MLTPKASETESDWIARCMNKWEDRKAESYTPTDAMAEEAQRGLDWRKEYNRGGTEVGVARARDIANGRNLSADTVKRMVSYFSRHEVDKQGEGWSKGDKGYPSAGRIALALWGGDPGRSWAERIAKQIEDEEKGVDVNIQYRNIALEIKREPDEDGRFEGYASVFGVVDQGMDVVERGAFIKSLSQRKPKMLWQHDPERVIGVWEEVHEDERGLYVKGRILKDIEKGREAMALLRAGAIDSMSIGYRTIEAIPEAGGRVRKLMEIDLFEVSLVTFPMLPDAKVTAVKRIETPRDFERFLRDAGFSRKQAVAITGHGFKAIDTQREAVGDDEQPEKVDLSPLLEKLSQLQETLRHG